MTRKKVIFTIVILLSVYAIILSMVFIIEKIKIRELLVESNRKDQEINSFRKRFIESLPKRDYDYIFALNYGFLEKEIKLIVNGIIIYQSVGTRELEEFAQLRGPGRGTGIWSKADSIQLKVEVDNKMEFEGMIIKKDGHTIILTSHEGKVTIRQTDRIGYM